MNDKQSGEYMGKNLEGITAGYYVFEDQYGNRFCGLSEMHALYSYWVVYPPTKFAPQRINNSGFEVTGTFYLLSELTFLTDVDCNPCDQSKLDQLNNAYLFYEPENAMQSMGFRRTEI